MSGKDERPERFLTLVDQHRGILHKVAGGYCRSAADREDLVQEMVVQLWRSFARYDERMRFSTWMYRVALNVAISFLRSESRRTRDVVPAEESILEIAAAPPDSGDEDLRRLERFIQGLDELDRALILLYLDGHKHDAIAEVLGISSTNVGTKISRLKTRLRREWDLVGAKGA